MMITGVIGLVALLVGLFMGIKYLKIEGKNVEEQMTSEPSIRQVQEVVINELEGVVERVDERRLVYRALESGQTLQMDLGEDVVVREKNDTVMPVAALELGDLVSVGYKEGTREIKRIKKITESWAKRELVGIKKGEEPWQIKIGSNTYRYDEELLVWDQYGQIIGVDDIGEHDILDLKGIGDRVYAIRVITREGYIQLDQLPSQEGVLEIDRNRQIPIGNISGPIPLEAGTHKITIQLKGYEPVTHTIEVKPEEIITMDLSGAKLIYGQLEVQVLEGVKDYEVHVGKVIYQAGERIEVLEGKYNVIVVAPGYKPWGMRVTLTGHVVLQVTLQKDKEETETQTQTETQTAVDEEIQQEIEPEIEAEPEPEIETEPETDEQDESIQLEDTNKVEEEIIEYRINMMTEPTGAKVFIHGEQKGITPFTTTLKNGDYIIVLEKEGYETYSTSIMIDNSDNQHNYLYALKPKN